VNKTALIIILLLVLGGGLYLFSGRTAEDSMDKQEPVVTTPGLEESDDATMEEDSMMEDEAMMESGSEPDDAMMEEDSMMEDEAMMESDVKTFEVNGGSYYFTPDTITVNEDDTVKIVFTNDGGTHDWVIDEFNARTPITQTGETAEIEFVADQAGTYEFYCSVGNHRELGMVGTLVVE
jgi:plastocyanin